MSQEISQLIYQVSLKYGASNTAWIDVDEATYNSAGLYEEYNRRALYAASRPPIEQEPELSDEQIEDVIEIADRAFRLRGGVRGQQLTAADSRDHCLMRAAIAADRKAREA